MNKYEWNKFLSVRDKFRAMVDEITAQLPKLKSIQQKFVNERSEKTYTVETPVVYNGALDGVTRDSEIKLIIVADNPGRREQEAANRRYLTGPSGKIAAKFFRDNPSLGIDYEKNVIILNKTPVHSPRTLDLRELEKTGGSSFSLALKESQKKMANILMDFHKVLNTPVYITGYSQMKKGGIFEAYTARLWDLYGKEPDLYNKLFFFRHFSMNQFTIDLNKKKLDKESVVKTLIRIGTDYRDMVFSYADRHNNSK